MTPQTDPQAPSIVTPAANPTAAEATRPSPPPAELRETHTAVVVMVGDRVYKSKKPVSLGFLDFSTTALRQAACVREVELNRRLAPDVYLGLGRLEQPGAEAETVVVMRRMPDDRRLSTLVAAGEPVDDDLRALARDLARFHGASPANPLLEREAGRDAVLRRWRESIAQVRELGVAIDTAVLDRLFLLVECFLAGRADLLERRIADGHVVDGHGDLQADDVFCLPDGPRALDCLEFDDALRHVDQLDDAAFLAMDLEHLGAPELAESFLDSYAEFSGDVAPVSLRHHYVAYRAFVRAKVACLRVVQGDDASAVVARDFAAIAVRHLSTGAVRLLLVGGLPGTGKSTVAGLLADRRGYVVLSSDRVRKELAGISPETPAAEGFGDGLYDVTTTSATYAELVRRARLLLAQGESVVLDASWTDASQRTLARDAAREASADLVEIVCTTPAAVAAGRMLTRAHGPSDADAAIAARMADRADAWPSASVVSTTGTPEAAVRDALDLL
jgi:aminoglycoside phosphotransferase family enzyme/predicted kinase